jgi:hypothetical protein
MEAEMAETEIKTKNIAAEHAPATPPKSDQLTHEQLVKLWGGGEHGKVAAYIREWKVSASDYAALKADCPGLEELMNQ